IAWGVWDAFGMGGMADGLNTEQLLRRGLTLMDPAGALAALQQVLDLDETSVAVVDVDWERFLPVFTSARPRPFFNELPEARQVADVHDGPIGGRDGVSPWAERLEALRPDQREQAITQQVCLHSAAVLGHSSPEAVDPGRAFRELGFDSLASVELRNRLM